RREARQGRGHRLGLTWDRGDRAQLDGDGRIRRAIRLPREAGAGAACRHLCERHHAARVSAELLVAGSIALDTLDGSFGHVEDELGGSALYFALAASLITPVRVVAPVGKDQTRLVEEVVGSRPVDLRHLQVIDAPTYRWRAHQEGGRNIDFGSQDSIYDHWQPGLPPGYSGWSFVGSMRPDRQAQVASGLAGSSLLAADAMLSYVRAQPVEARDVLRRARGYFCNHEEFGAPGGAQPPECPRRCG